MISRVDVFPNIKIIIFVSLLWGLVPSVFDNCLMKCTLLCYSLLTTVFFIRVCILFNFCAFERITQSNNNVKLLIKIIYAETTLRCILLLVLLLISLFKSRQLLHILKKLVNLDVLLNRKLHVEIPTKQNFLLQIAYAVYIVFYCVYYCFQLRVANYSWSLSVQWATLSTISLIIASQFTIFIHAFNIRFKLFNAFFTNMNLLCSSTEARHWNCFDFNTKNVHRTFNMVLSEFKLKELHIIYLTMRDLLYEINSYYSFQVLFIVCETVAILIASISTFTFNIAVEDFATKSTNRNLTLIHCGLRLLCITLLIHVAEETSKEVSIGKYTIFFFSFT